MWVSHAIVDLQLTLHMQKSLQLGTLWVLLLTRRVGPKPSVWEPADSRVQQKLWCSAPISSHRMEKRWKRDEINNVHCPVQYIWKIFRQSASLWRKECVVRTFWFCTLILLMKPLALPVIAATPSVQTLMQFFQLRPPHSRYSLVTQYISSSVVFFAANTCRTKSSHKFLHQIPQNPKVVLGHSRLLIHQLAERIFQIAWFSLRPRLLCLSSKVVAYICDLFSCLWAYHFVNNSRTGWYYDLFGNSVGLFSLSYYFGYQVASQCIFWNFCTLEHHLFLTAVFAFQTNKIFLTLVGMWWVIGCQMSFQLAGYHCLVGQFHIPHISHSSSA